MKLKTFAIVAVGLALAASQASAQQAPVAPTKAKAASGVMKGVQRAAPKKGRTNAAAPAGGGPFTIGGIGATGLFIGTGIIAVGIASQSINSNS